jgi:hypothetical protein
LPKPEQNSSTRLQMRLQPELQPTKNSWRSLQVLAQH